MILSFTARLLCVAAVMTGLIHVIVEAFLWLAAPLIVRMSEPLSARYRERVLYALQLVPIASALLLTCAVCIPQYLQGETNREAESVGWLCIVAAVAVGLWYGHALLNGLAAAARTMIFARACRRTSSRAPFFRAGTPILSCAGKAYGVALVGLFRPFILISESLLGEGGLSAKAIDLALDHEASHAKQLDNWKLFSLHCTPTLRLRLRNGRTWTEMWHAAAEWAADDDAVRNDGARVLVLAETLVAVARSAAPSPQRVCMALECNELDLVARIDRLIDRPKPMAASRSWGRICCLSIAAAGFVGTAAGIMLSSRDLLERLLHLGQG
jgi:hypothetical protein